MVERLPANHGITAITACIFAVIPTLVRPITASRHPMTPYVCVRAHACNPITFIRDAVIPRMVACITAFWVPVIAVMP